MNYKKWVWGLPAFTAVMQGDTSGVSVTQRGHVGGLSAAGLLLLPGQLAFPMSLSRARCLQ